MNATCPVCGAPLEFRYDDSFVRICGSCKSAIVRADRELSSLGKVADLVPTASSLRLFAEGRFGSSTFLLVGMAQIRHGKGGLWQEWYAKLDGRWAWVSEAQGRYYLTFEQPETAVPPFDTLAPGVTVELGGRRYVVGEVDVATYASALGEIPYRLDPQAQFRFVDLSDGAGGFATIDYGDLEGTDEPTVYIGQQVPLAELAIHGGEEQLGQTRATQGKAINCPNCGGALELAVPDQALRIGCPYCNHLISVESGIYAVLAKMTTKPTPRLKLGSKATFSEGELTIIGYLQRSALVDGVWYPFSEYLLYAPQIGFRWLVQSDGHWSYVQPVANGAVLTAPYVTYEGQRFEHYQVADLRVDQVLGEFYWRVEVGERVASDDYIAPPAMLSVERTQDEMTWSLSTYVSHAELEKAIGMLTVNFDAPIGVAPNQPYKLKGIGWVALAAFGLFFVVAMIRASAAENKQVFGETVTVPSSTPGLTPSSAGAGSDPFDDILKDPAMRDLFRDDPSMRDRVLAYEAKLKAPAPLPTGATPEAPSTVVFTKPFELAAGKNIAVEMFASLSNNWAYAAIDLVNEETGGIVGFDANLEYYSGYDGGESWSEGSQSKTQYLAPMEAGKYVLRVEGQHGSGGNFDLTIRVKQDVWRGFHFYLAFGLLSAPFLGLAFHALRFKKKRWENSNVKPSGGGDDE